MKLTRVQYQVQPDFAATNKANVEKVMADVRNLNDPGLKYATYVLDDGVTFMHLAFFSNDESAGKLGKLDSFNAFRKALKESGPVSPPNAENLSLVASGYDLF